jgi:hypothetical protein
LPKLFYIFKPYTAAAPTADSQPMTLGCHGRLLIMEEMGNFLKDPMTIIDNN